MSKFSKCGYKDIGEKHACFELEKETGQITLKIFNSDSGEIQIRLSPEEVAKGLKELEECEENLTALSHFFIQ